MSIFDDRWFEIWSYSAGGKLRPTWLYVVTPNEDTHGQILVFDPQENYRVVFTGQSYEETRIWLHEDEFQIVEGRMFHDDGFPLRTKPTT
jgi:hypothetical protein